MLRRIHTKNAMKAETPAGITELTPSEMSTVEGGIWHALAALGIAVAFDDFVDKTTHGCRGIDCHNAQN